MTRTISLIIGIAVVALVAVPTAFGEGRLAGSEPQATPASTYVDANQRGSVVQTMQIERRTDAWGRTATAPHPSTYRDAGERVVSPKPGSNGYVDANQRGTGPVSATPTVVSSTSSGTDIDWAQLGIGLGIGVALAFGLLLVFRPSRRLLAH